MCRTISKKFPYRSRIPIIKPTRYTKDQQDHDGMSWSCWSQAVRHIPLLCVQWKTADDGQRNCPKHVEFYSKNKFEKLVHLVGFIMGIYHDARSPERQNHSRRRHTLTQLKLKPVNFTCSVASLLFHHHADVPFTDWHRPSFTVWRRHKLCTWWCLLKPAVVTLKYHDLINMLLL